METNILSVKNMVCRRCVLAVEAILQKESIPFDKVEIGAIHLPGILEEAKAAQLRLELARIGFELIDDRMNSLIESIRQLVLKKARNQLGEKEARMKLSDFLAGQLHHAYTYLSALFSANEGRTIERYYIEQRIEMAKELLSYGEMTLSQIALELEYSSTAHLSNQFRKVTGMTPSEFRQTGVVQRKALDQV